MKTQQQLFIERMRTRRLDLGYTQDRLGSLLGVTGSTVSNWERSRHTVTLNDAAAIAKALKMDLWSMLSEAAS